MQIISFVIIKGSHLEILAETKKINKTNKQTKKDLQSHSKKSCSQNSFEAQVLPTVQEARTCIAQRQKHSISIYLTVYRVNIVALVEVKSTLHADTLMAVQLSKHQLA